VAQCLVEHTQIPWAQVISDFLGWYLWGLLFPLIWCFTRRYPLERQNLLLRLPINLAFAFLITFVYLLLSLIKREAINAFTTGTFSLRQAVDALPDYLFSGIEYYLLIYIAMAALNYAAVYYTKYREREVKASRLEAQLVLAHLEVLKMQLHPHFLFNTLNAISALMHRDVDAADRMISLLSDLLRLALDDDHRHQVPLGEEIEFLERYLAIERIRFRDRLSVEINIEPPSSRAQVPRLILQPLVENSIRHGIAMRSAAGRVGVYARRIGNRLDVRVCDDGPGIADASKLKEGVGLANTKARLQQIYGTDHLFELRTAKIGGLEIHLEIPFETEPRLDVPEDSVA
jgi:sensor histidine kinase YesM